MFQEKKGIAVFSAVISYFVLIAGTNIYLKVSGTLVEDKSLMERAGQTIVLGMQAVRMDVFGGILSGLTAAILTDRFYKTHLPIAFAFFPGKN